MKNLLLAVVLLGASAAVARPVHVGQKPSALQIEKAQDLPQTVVIRRSLKNPKDIAVIHSKNKLAAGQKLSTKAFEKMALNSQVRGLAFNQNNELDKGTSTDSWSFGLYGAGYGGYGRGGYGYGRGYGYGGGYNGGYYGNNYGYGGGYGGGYDSYYPSYSYYNNTYRYSSYYSYQDQDYNYDYCGWDY